MSQGRFMSQEEVDKLINDDSSADGSSRSEHKPPSGPLTTYDNLFNPEGTDLFKSPDKTTFSFSFDSAKKDTDKESGITEEVSIENEPGINEEVTVEPGVTEEVSVEPGITEEVTIEDGVTEEVSIEPGVTEEVSIEDGVTEEVTVEGGVTEEVTAEPGVTEEVTVEPGVTEEVSIEKEPGVTEEVSIEIEPGVEEEVTIEKEEGVPKEISLDESERSTHERSETKSDSRPKSLPHVPDMDSDNDVGSERNSVPSASSAVKPPPSQPKAPPPIRDSTSSNDGTPEWMLKFRQIMKREDKFEDDNEGQPAQEFPVEQRPDDADEQTEKTHAASEDAVTEIKATIDHEVDAREEIKDTSEHGLEDVAGIKDSSEHERDAVAEIKDTSEHEPDAVAKIKDTSEHDQDDVQDEGSDDGISYDEEIVFESEEFTVEDDRSEDVPDDERSLGEKDKVVSFVGLPENPPELTVDSVELQPRSAMEEDDGEEEESEEEMHIEYEEVDEESDMLEGSEVVVEEYEVVETEENEKVDEEAEVEEEEEVEEDREEVEEEEEEDDETDSSASTPPLPEEVHSNENENQDESEYDEALEYDPPSQTSSEDEDDDDSDVEIDGGVEEARNIEKSGLVEEIRNEEKADAHANIGDEPKSENKNENSISVPLIPVDANKKSQKDETLRSTKNIVEVKDQKGDGLLKDGRKNEVVKDRKKDGTLNAVGAVSQEEQTLDLTLDTATPAPRQRRQSTDPFVDEDPESQNETVDDEVKDGSKPWVILVVLVSVIAMVTAAAVLITFSQKERKELPSVVLPFTIQPSGFLRSNAPTITPSPSAFFQPSEALESEGTSAPIPGPDPPVTTSMPAGNSTVRPTSLVAPTSSPTLSSVPATPAPVTPSPSPLPATPAPTVQPTAANNDLCFNAIGPLEQDSTTVGSLESAGEDLVDVCGDVSSVGGPGVWYSVLGTGGEMMAHTCLGTSFDSKVTIFKGSCDKPECIEANDDFCGSQSAVSWDSNYLQVYHILVQAQTDFSGDGLFTLSMVSRYNDECSTAIGPLTVGLGPIVEGSTERANPNSEISCDGSTNMSPSVWYTVQGTGGEMTASICEGLDFDASVTLLDGSCSDLQCVGQTDVGECELSWESLPFHTYFILIRGEDENDLGNFGLRLTTTAVPDNNQCADALGPLPLNGSAISGSTLGADVDSRAPFCLSSITAPGVWYYVEGNGATLQASLCQGASYDTRISVYEGDCTSEDSLNDLICIDGNDDFCGQESLVAWASEAGKRYYVLVHGYLDLSGDFTLSLTSI